MYVCVCNAVTDSDILSAVDGGVRTQRQLTRETGCSGSCGKCRVMAGEILRQALNEHREVRELLPLMQPA
jgi:bacterioferritin-associated ferredoxin